MAEKKSKGWSDSARRKAVKAREEDPKAKKKAPKRSLSQGVIDRRKDKADTNEAYSMAMGGASMLLYGVGIGNAFLAQPLAAAGGFVAASLAAGSSRRADERSKKYKAQANMLATHRMGGKMPPPPERTPARLSKGVIERRLKKEKVGEVAETVGGYIGIAGTAGVTASAYAAGSGMPIAGLLGAIASQAVGKVGAALSTAGEYEAKRKGGQARSLSAKQKKYYKEKSGKFKASTLGKQSDASGGKRKGWTPESRVAASIARGDVNIAYGGNPNAAGMFSPDAATGMKKASG